MLLDPASIYTVVYWEILNYQNTCSSPCDDSACLDSFTHSQIPLDTSSRGRGVLHAEDYHYVDGRDLKVGGFNGGPHYIVDSHAT